MLQFFRGFTGLFITVSFLVSCGAETVEQRYALKAEEPIAMEGRLGESFVGSCQQTNSLTGEIVVCQEWQVVEGFVEMYDQVETKCNNGEHISVSSQNKTAWVYTPCPRIQKKTLGGCRYPVLEQISGADVGDLIIWQYVEEDNFSSNLQNSLKEACESAETSTGFVYP